MADTIKTLVEPTPGTAAEATLYDPASGIKGILSRVHVVNTTSTAQTFRLYKGAAAAADWLYYDITVQPGGFFSHGGAGHIIDGTLAQDMRWNAPATLTISVVGIEET